ncbi:hypothetical protein ACOJBO_23155 [Rhizobium beringeri]
MTGGFTIDPAGTGGWHEGESPDQRSIATANNHGIDISGSAPGAFSRGISGISI